ncbi:carbazole dioxygenase [Erythrobacter sp. KY5]|uniref:Rieske 2Fe-2S domain-containing protein n=1 Tax=Erythrobacter sp. KY5 TaxID=2011159 RepID=UPI000DBF0D79|nr:Rieske 2Fe-2S domain-containing protein [Erythrobacter sp. KY5]AWW74410.1 carbazole dioxygenase [Erythrobacter sp. KY5]
MTSGGFVEPEIIEKVRVGKDYVAAKYGFRNHWYPVLLSSELTEDNPVAATVCGENILFNRLEGEVKAIKDQCLHKGVRFSRHLECYKKGTVTCWYHGFTYRYEDGQLNGIVGVPDSKIIGTRRIRTYPVTEAKGVVFVFVGDEYFDVPPLSHDVPPDFLEEGFTVCGRRQEVASNWRVGCENGFDSTHIFIHKNSTLVKHADLALPLGLVPTGKESFKIQDEDGGPKGVFDLFSPETVNPVFEGKIEGEGVLSGAADGKNLLPHSISMWLPCALCIKPWPVPELKQFEWYVPIDGERHVYFQFLGKYTENEEEEQAFAKEFEERWVPEALIGFNEDDIWAREATQPFYADGSGWVNEQLFEADENIVKWRRLAHKHNRGLQEPKHVDPA